MARLSTKHSELERLVRDIGRCIKRIDSRRPQAGAYKPGIGPHPEGEVVARIAQELARLSPSRYRGRIAINVRYPDTKRQTCDFCLQSRSGSQWSVEFKLFRSLGDNGKSNDNMLMHILSPYPKDRSALTDCEKIVSSSLAGRKAIVIYGFDYPDRPMDPVITAFEILSANTVRIGPRTVAAYSDLVHPIHTRGRVFGWEVKRRN